MPLPIYLDYAATTPVDPSVAEAMAGCLTREGIFANPASRSHIYGWQAEEQVEKARRHVADLIHSDPREIAWTSGATESNNLALKGVFEAENYQGHLITSTIEHKAVIDPAKWLEQKGVKVTWLAPDADGVISAEQVKQALTEDTKLVSIMQINNETGAINPIAEIGRICRDNHVLLHVDAAQAAGKVPVDTKALQVDLMSLCAHKFYGPKGIGALYVRRPVQPQLNQQMHGGGHERGMRSGTLPTHQIVGMGEASRLAAECLAEEAPRIERLRNLLWSGIADLPGVKRNGSTEQVSPGHLNVCFSGVEGETLLLSLRELAVSTGSACTSASMEPSYVLTAMGVSNEDAHSSIRFSLGRFTTEENVSAAVAHIRTIYTQLQQAQSA
ncbi:IscS subfamily cysteine desulfurase [Oceanicoccus sagamiensis]|uniref:cysteine desulfurase n=1 Tax=Oceanicoccus sagamiensis TaxID=716816 RepID=A0A1X9NMN3_9GAMM|nr:IscS subfamily cysteine desulfurase [Oceanicoccus sagamiensis]ARN76047.1 IscS subfamily cysteine desulfurase [Oceanicoccus sagamiensis]